VPASPEATAPFDRSWFTKGDAACPSLDVRTPGSPPGAAPQDGHLVRASGDVHCEAGGVPHGPATRLFGDGTPAEAGDVRRGRREGVWQTFHPTGQLASAGLYQNGMS